MMIKMQSPNLANREFLQDYHPVLSHHINCILNSRLILDEDMNLLLTFWDPSTKEFIRRGNTQIVASAACAVVGLSASAKLRSLYPFSIAVLPATLQIFRSMKVCYFRRNYKRNFENLLSGISEFYKLCCDMLEYYHKRDMATNVYKMPAGVYTILAKPGEEFLKSAVIILISILEKIRNSMVETCDLVPITEGEYIYSVEWNFEDLKNINCDDLKQLQHQLQKLIDLYVLIVSNFLGSLGLSFCIQLWKETSCSFKNIFDSIIPELACFLDASLHEIKTRFDRIRFTLHSEQYGVDKKSHEKSKYTKDCQQLQRPLADFLANMQVTFETGKQLQLLLDHCDFRLEFESLSPLVEDVSNQLAVCDDSLDAFLKVFCLLTRKSASKKLDSVSLTVPNNESKISAEIHHDDPEELLEDEEYNLYVHGSEEEDLVPQFTEYADQCSTEDLELMLHELKKKLKERKGGQDMTQEKHNEMEVSSGRKAYELGSSQKVANNYQLPSGANSLARQSVPPVPPPPPFLFQNITPSVPALPEAGDQILSAENSYVDFLDAVKNVAQKLNRDEEFQFGFNMFPEIPRPFNTTYRCFSVAMLPGNERQDVERGGKIIMPPSALEQLTRLNINYPMLFKIVNKKTDRITHCGVLEFVADEGKVYLPLWMMHNLVLEEGDLIQIESVSLPVGTFAKFQPLSPDFLDITNPKAVLENCLRTFACLTSGDVIAVKYNQRVYELCVLETQPGNAISIIECDMNVEFAPPVGYKESEEVKRAEEDMVVDPADLMPEPSGFVAFRGTGNRLDGKRRKDSASSESSPPKPVYVRGIPDYDYQIGTLKFLRHFTKSPVDNKDENEEFKAFSGEGFSLKRRN